MEKKKKKKKKNKTWEVVGYYLDGKGSWTLLRDPKTGKEKKIKGIA